MYVVDTALTLSNLQRRQSGMYECLARNSLGMTHAAAHLAVIDTQAAASDTTRPPHVPPPLECEFFSPFIRSRMSSGDVKVTASSLMCVHEISEPRNACLRHYSIRSDHDLDLRPLTLKNLSAVSTHVMNICAKFQ